MKTQVENLILSDLYDLAYAAHSWTSFSPDKRAVQVVKEYSGQLTEDLSNMPESHRGQYTQKYKELLSSWLRSRSMCASSMITGPANFNVRRNKKRQNAAENKYIAFSEFREKFLKAVERQIEQSKSPEQKTNEEWDRIKKDIESSLATIHRIDTGEVRGYSRALLVSNLCGRITTLSRNGKKDLVNRSLDLIAEYNKQCKKPLITSRNSIWNLREKVEQVIEAKEDRSNQESVEFEFPGGMVIKNYQMERIQIKHDSKPDKTVIELLKKNAFKWSPSQGVWQRQLTGNAIEATKRIVGIEF